MGLLRLWQILVPAVALAACGGTSPAEHTAPSTSPARYESVDVYLRMNPSPAADLSHPYIRGKVVMVWSGYKASPDDPDVPGSQKGIDEAWWHTGAPVPGLEPQRPDDIGTVIIGDCQAVFGGRLGNPNVGGISSRTYGARCNLAVVDKAANLIVGGATFTVDAPSYGECSASGGCTDEVAGAPANAIAGFIEALPRVALTDTASATAAASSGERIPTDACATLSAADLDSVYSPTYTFHEGEKRGGDQFFSTSCWWTSDKNSAGYVAAVFVDFGYFTPATTPSSPATAEPSPTPTPSAEPVSGIGTATAYYSQDVCGEFEQGKCGISSLRALKDGVTIHIRIATDLNPESHDEGLAHTKAIMKALLAKA